ncbi:SPFH domain-containing protein [Nitrospirillum sp. BR 11828]|uniref:SPFH domain-containing protein n=1 Tax=Nitrospirillum sp. BR 11828 TaxID=3104325 RepID=UPI002ACA5442|nr:SPFH domain-containing protein [Nitrospirillum sp. BR 11828]MDZ5645856.1 SPFH domain-containing protein [Nitrospirillum sp. BR 11828]
MTAATDANTAPPAAKPGLRARFKAWRRRHRLNIFLAVLVLAFLVVALADRIFINIPAGSVGVLWLRLAGGTQLGFHFNPGLKIIAPWDRIYIYDVRLRRLDETVQALTRDGLSVDVQLTISYFIDRDLVANLHETLGPQFETTLILPTMSSEIRNAMAELRPDDLYSINRSILEQRVATLVRNELTRSHLDMGGNRQMLNIQDIFIRNIALPPTVQASIEQKIAEEQNALRFQFVLEKERLESERKAIEAQGVRQFQEIVSNGISDRYLRWKGIEATLALAKSPNAKVVVIGSQNGLPLILDTTDRGSALPADLVGSGTEAPPSKGPRVGTVPAAPGNGGPASGKALGDPQEGSPWPPPLPDGVAPLDAAPRTPPSSNQGPPHQPPLPGGAAPGGSQGAAPAPASAHPAAADAVAPQPTPRSPAPHAP